MNEKTIVVFDLDDTLIYTTSKVYYRLPNDSKEYSASTREFAEIRTTLPKEAEYDFREFRNFKAIYKGIVDAEPNIPILQKLDNAVNSGYKIGILTARGGQSAILAAVKDKLLFKDKKGKFKKIPRTQFRKRWLFAVGDSNTEKALKKMGAYGDGMKDPQGLKTFVLEEILLKKEGFDLIVYYDDDPVNVNAVKQLNNKKIKTILV